MIGASAHPARELSTVRLHPAARRVRSGADDYVAGLEAQLAISESQLQAWAGFAAALSANGRRMRSDNDEEDQPFGPLRDRLAALRSMRHAAAELFPVLSAAQQCRARQLLPLCCLPQAAAPFDCGGAARALGSDDDATGT